MSNPINNNVGAVDVIAMNPHDVIDQMYGYSGVFRDGTALVPHPAELPKKYAERRQFSCMTNIFQTIVDATYSRVFDQQIKRETTSEAFSEFLKNVDNKGTGIDIFMKQSVARQTRKHSTYFIIMDNFGADQMPQTEDDVKNMRAFPYVYTKKPQDVYASDVDRFGNIVSITFTNGTFTDGDGKKYPQYLEISKEYFSSFYIKKNSQGNEEKINIGEPVANAIGVVPVIVARDEQSENGQLCASPRMYGVMRVCYVIYNKDAEMREIDRRQSFSTAYFFGDAPPSPGTGSALLLPMDAKAPGFLEPNPGIQGTNIDGAKYYQENLYRMCEQNGIVGVKSASSGVALAFEFMARDSVLCETATICESVEKQMAYLFGLWTKQNIEYVCEYDRSYTPVDNTVQLKVIDEVLLNIDRMPSRISKDAFRWLARRVNPSISNDELDEIETEIEIGKQDTMQDQDGNI